MKHTAIEAGEKGSRMLSRRGFVAVAGIAAASSASLFGCSARFDESSDGRSASDGSSIEALVANASLQFDGVGLAPYVQPEMLYPGYWSSKVDSPGQVILDAHQIELMNQHALEVAPSLVFDLLAFEYSVDGATVSGLITQFDAIDEPLSVDGADIEEAQWQALLARRDIESIGASVEPRYGVSVSRGDMRLWPTSDFGDQPQQSGILPGEPVVILHETADGSWYFVATSFCVGWISALDIARFESFSEWREVAVEPNDFYQCLADETLRVLLPDATMPQAFETYLGGRLARATEEDWKLTSSQVEATGKYVVKRFSRTSDGLYSQEALCLPAAANLSRGYLPYSIENVLRVAFSLLGDPYGWGGWGQGRDCSQFTMEIYKCFGILLSRDAEPQAQMPFMRTEFGEEVPDAEKETALRQTRPTSLLEFNGHVMMYLGEVGGRFYVISDVGTFAPSPSEDPQDFSCVLVNTLDAVRPNGKTWMQSLRTIIMVEPA